jgi:hypothetical protein
MPFFKDTLVIGRGEAYKGCEMLRIPHFRENQLTVGGQAVGLKCRPRFTHLCCRLSKPKGDGEAGSIT